MMSSLRWRIAHAAIALAAMVLSTTSERVIGQELPLSTITPIQETGAETTSFVAEEYIAGAPHVQTIAQGLINVEGPVIWRVRELGLGATGTPETAATSFALQRIGASIFRDELTRRRTRLEPGEAYFMASGDPYLRHAVGSHPSVVWIVELLPVETAARGILFTGTVHFTSDAVGDYPNGTFEVELQRGILLEEEVAELPPYTGPALLMVTSGQVQASTGGGQPSPVTAGNGRLITAGLTLRNADAHPAAFFVAALAEPVDGAERPAVVLFQTPPATAPALTVETVPLEPSPDPVVESAPVAPAAHEASSPGVATIRVIAEGDIRITVIADDMVVFSQWLGAGGATDWYTASVFEVTTTDGSVTLFENAESGEQFYMGYGQNETYYLSG